MFKKLKEYFKPLPLVEQWALNNSKRCTPDEIIAASIIQSFAKHFEDWTITGEFNQRYEGNSYSSMPHPRMTTPVTTRLRNVKKDITVDVVFRRTTKMEGYSPIYKYTDVGCLVNGVRLDDACWREIRRNWNNMVVDVMRAKQVAAEAEARMKKNEAAWNLAENLLGMRRNEFGALVPIEPEPPKPAPIRRRPATAVKI